MFFAVEALHLTDGRSYASHKAVISAFNQQFVQPGVFIRAMGRALSQWRFSMLV